MLIANISKLSDDIQTAKYTLLWRIKHNEEITEEDLKFIDGVFDDCLELASKCEGMMDTFRTAGQKMTEFYEETSWVLG